MPNYSMDEDAEYWQAPERFRKLLEMAPSMGVKNAIFPLGDPNDENTAMAVVLQMEPGYVITRHAHPCDRFETVVRGTLEFNGRVYRAGDVLTAKPNEFYGPKTAGKDGCTTIEIFSKAKGVYHRMTQDENGQTVVTNLLEAWETAFAGQIKKHQARA